MCFFYNLYRVYYNVKYMSVCIIYRNNFFYYLFMFLFWFFGVLIYLGLGWIYVFYLVVKFIVIIGVYVEWKWDRLLY